MYISMDYDKIVGGIGEIHVQTIPYGKNDMIVGGSATDAGRNKILHLKHAPDNIKKLLAIINMARPVVFGNINFDDGKSSKLEKGPRMATPDNAVLSMLKNRLNKKPDDVVTMLVDEYKLKEPVYWAITDLIKLLLRYIKNKRPHMRAIKIDGDIGEILNRVKNGDSFFKIATDHKNWPNSIHGIVQELLEILIRERMPNGIWSKPELNAPQWPAMCDKNAATMQEMSKQNYKSVREYVEAIVIREHVLIKHMDAVEEYYIKSAEDINKYTEKLKLFLKSAAPVKNNDNGYIIVKKDASK